MEKAIIYCRISKDEEKRKGISIGEQRTQCLDYVEKHGSLMVSPFDVEVIIDEGKSGRDWDREGAQILWERLKNGEIKHVIVHRIDRLSRSIRDLVEIADFMKQKGIKFHSILDQVNLDTPEGWLFYAMKGVFSEFERLRVGFNTSKALKRKQQEGIHVGRPPFGFNVVKGKLVKVPEEQEVIDEAVYMAHGGLSTSEIAVELALPRTTVANILNRSGNGPSI